MTLIYEDPKHHIGVTETASGHHLITLQAVASGASLFHIHGEQTPRPSRHSLQLDTDLHINSPSGTSEQDQMAKGYWRYLNHRCDPNVCIRDLDVIALRPIASGEEITFDYDTTEYDMSEPFKCHCGSKNCRGWIRGFKHLNTAQQEAFRAQLLPYLLRHLDGM